MTIDETIEILRDDIEVCTLKQQAAINTAIYQLKRIKSELKPRGKWINIGDWLEGRKYGKDHGEMIDAYACDYCGYQQYFKTSYCPHCGAEMGGEDGKKI